MECAVREFDVFDRLLRVQVQVYPDALRSSSYSLNVFSSIHLVQLYCWCSLKIPKYIQKDGFCLDL